MTSARILLTWRIVLLPTLVVTLCFILMENTAHADEQIDQSNLPEWAGGWTHVNPTSEGHAAMWQTFTPTRPNVIAVEIDILTVSPGQGDDVLTVEIAKEGNILASADRSVTNGFDGLLRFEFPDAVPLVPEQIYELTVRDTGKTRFGWKYGSNSYQRGSRYVFAQERPGTDWFFQTYSNVEPAQAKYSGGTGDPNDPYRIATAEDLMVLGESPEDYDKHFILTADIDLDPNLPGRKVFDTAVIAPHLEHAYSSSYEGTPFNGVFDGNGHVISHLTIIGNDFLGLCGCIGSGAEIRDLGVVDANIAGSGRYIGGLAGSNGNWPNFGGVVSRCYTTGVFCGDWSVGGLVGCNGGDLTDCCSEGTIVGENNIGGLAGEVYRHTIGNCYAAGTVNGNSNVGGLVGYCGPDQHRIVNCFSTSTVSGNSNVGGLVGFSMLRPISVDGVMNCYFAGAVFGSKNVGGLVGNANLNGSQLVRQSFWDIETSGQTTSDGGRGLTTAELQKGSTFRCWIVCGEEPVWTIDDGNDYPRLQWENQPGRPIEPIELSGLLLGEGTESDPYLITTAEQLNLVSWGLCDWDKHFRLMADIDLSLPEGATFAQIGVEYDSITGGNTFRGVFDGNGHTIMNLYLSSTNAYGIGFFGHALGATIRNLGLLDPYVDGGSGRGIGALIGSGAGIVANCYVERGVVSGNYDTGGLVGSFGSGSIIQCHATAAVTGFTRVGGLMGYNSNGNITNCYARGSVSGSNWIGGLLGWNGIAFPGASIEGTIESCYCTCTVLGSGKNVGGLLARNDAGNITASFWDVQTSGQVTSDGGTGKTTAEMQTAATFLDAGWDFMGETANGTEDIWWINEGKDYPRLWWESK